MLKFAVRNLLSRPMRSLLSLLGLTVAITGMVGLFSVARGLDRVFSTTFNRIHGLIAMQPGAPIPLFSHLPAAWGDEIAALPGVSIVSPEIWARVNVIDGRMIVNPPRFLFGCDLPTRLRLKQGVYRDDIVAGRFLSLEDRGTLHAVVSRPIAEEFGKTLGDTLRVNGYELTIVGIYDCGSVLLDVTILVDIGEVRRMARFDDRSVSAFYIEQTGTVDDKTLLANIRDQFRGRAVEPSASMSSNSLWDILSLTGNPLIDLARAFASWMDSVRRAEDRNVGKGELAETAPDSRAAAPPIEDPPSSKPARPAPETTSKPIRTPRPARSSSSAKDDVMKVDADSPIDVRGADTIAARFDKMAGDLNVILAVLTGIGVTIAVLSIVNTMLMSVTERIIEFGILKANGWSKTDVLRLITFESGLLGIGGGVLGSFLGWVATHIINAVWPTRAALFASPGLLAFSVGFSTALGVLGGLYPAFWAMRMMPMDAIRRG